MDLRWCNYSFNVLMPKSEYPKVFNVSSIPRTYLIDQKGNIKLVRFTELKDRNAVKEAADNLLDKLQAPLAEGNQQFLLAPQIVPILLLPFSL